MTRAKVISIAFLTGLIIGCAVPAAKASSVETYVTTVDSETCTITLDTDTTYDVDCDDLDNFEEGDFVRVLVRDGVTVLFDEVSGAKVITND